MDGISRQGTSKTILSVEKLLDKPSTTFQSLFNMGSAPSITLLLIACPRSVSENLKGSRPA